MTYKHKRTGTVISIPSELISPDWEKIAPENSGRKEKRNDERKGVRKRK